MALIFTAKAATVTRHYYSFKKPNATYVLAPPSTKLLLVLALPLLLTARNAVALSTAAARQLNNKQHDVE